MTILQTLYPIPDNVPRTDASFNTFTGVNRFTRVVAGNSTPNEAYDLCAGTTKIGSTLTVIGDTTLNIAKAALLTITGSNAMIFQGFGSSQGRITLFGWLGVDSGDTLAIIDRVGMSNYRWALSASQMTLNDNAVWHAGNFNPDLYLKVADASSTYVKLANSNNNITGTVWGLRSVTASGSDTLSIQIQSGGAYQYGRGAVLELNGKNATGSNAGGFRLLSDGPSAINSYSGTLSLAASGGGQITFNSSGLSLQGATSVAGATTFASTVAVTGLITATGQLKVGPASGEARINFGLDTGYIYSSATSIGYYWPGSSAVNLWRLIKPGQSEGVYPALSMIVSGGGYFDGIVRATSSLISIHPDALRMRQSARTVIHRFDGNAYYWLRTAADDPDGVWDSARPMTYNVGGDQLTFNPAGGITAQTKLTLSNAAPLGFTGFGAAGAIYIHGTNGGGDDVCTILRNNANSNYTLTWNGAVTITGSQTVAGEAYCNNWFRSNSSGTGWYHQVHGGGWYMSDNDYVRSYNQKAVAGSDFVIWSDRRSKTEDRDLSIADVLPKFMGLAPKWYVKNGTKAEYGMFAQDVRALFPDMVSLTNNEGYDDYHFLWINMLHAPHILVTQDNVRRIEELEGIVASQQHQIAQLQSRLEV